MSVHCVIRYARGFFSKRGVKVLGGLALIGSGVSYVHSSGYLSYSLKVPNSMTSFPLLVNCAAKQPPQSSVINETKAHALYLTIHLTSAANTGGCLKAVGGIKGYVDKISPPDLRDEDDEIWYGVGFGPNFTGNVLPKDSKLKDFAYQARKSELGDMPSTGGDIFIHAKCHQRGKLFELAQMIMNAMPSGSVAKYEDIYGWVYRGGRDLTGFIDGTENPADPDERTEAAIDSNTGGSYAITQKWVHKHDVIRSSKDDVKSQWVGREISDSTELKKKSNTSHVARMVGSAGFDAPSKFTIVRHSQPWGSVSGDSGLFFIAYSKTPEAFNWMLDRMTGGEADKQCDDVMRMTECVTGSYWFFPSQTEFDRITNGAGKRGFWG